MQNRAMMIYGEDSGVKKSYATVEANRRGRWIAATLEQLPRLFKNSTPAKTIVVHHVDTSKANHLDIIKKMASNTFLPDSARKHMPYLIFINVDGATRYPSGYVKVINVKNNFMGSP